MSTGVLSMGGKKERARKFHVADKVGEYPQVLHAEDESQAASFWAKRTGQSVIDAVVTTVGSRGYVVATQSKQESEQIAPTAEKPPEKK